MVRLSISTGLLAVMASLACEAPPEHAQPASSALDASAVGTLSEVRGFSWVADGLLGAMPRPGVTRPLSQDLSALRNGGISLLVSLTEEPLEASELRRARLSTLHLPVKDFTAPTQAQMHAFVAAVERMHAAGESVGVHCTAGLGRTGTMVAAYFVSKGLRASEAIAQVRQLRPGSIETTNQEDAVAEFATAFAPTAGSALDAFEH